MADNTEGRDEDKGAAMVDIALAALDMFAAAVLDALEPAVKGEALRNLRKRARRARKAPVAIRGDGAKADAEAAKWIEGKLTDWI